MHEAMKEYFFNLIIVIPVVILLAIISIKMSRKGIDKFNSSSYIQIVEKVYLSKDTFLYFLKTGKEGSIVIVSQHNIEKIKDLNEEEMEEVLKAKKEKSDLPFLYKSIQGDMKSILHNKSIRNKDNGNIK